jgi:glycosyltransferase involved in cell wall biosynthesis
VHTHSSKAGILGRWAAYFSRVPVIIHTFHGFGFNEFQNSLKRWVLVAVERLTARISKSLIFVSHSNIRTAIEKRIGKPDRYSLIHSGIHRPTPQKEIRQIRREIGVKENDIVCFSISCLKPQKNMLDFIRLAKIVSDRSVDVPLKFVVAGDGEERSEIEHLILKNNLGGKVVLLGWRRDATKLLAVADIYVMTSLWEGLPRALLEAMALGKPSCVYAADGTKDVIEHGKNGYIVPKKDVEALAECVHRFMYDKQLRDEIGKNAKESMKDEYFIDTMVKKIDSHYQGLINRKPN